MSRILNRSEALRSYIIQNIEAHPRDIAKITSKKFAISRQAVSKQLRNLVREGALVSVGNTRNKAYSLAPLVEWEKQFTISSSLQEDSVWREDIAPALGQQPQNALNIWQYGFTEMFNNAIDHSEGTSVNVDLRKTAATTQIIIHDNGIGIFNKIQQAIGLMDERHAILELAKGKLTTDPAHHSGEGIFFASRMFDEFRILSGSVFFSHEYDNTEDWILASNGVTKGTLVWMELKNHTSRTAKKVFDKFSSAETYGFNKTVVPVNLLRYGHENLVSRSQAKRLLARFERFQIVILDFKGVELVGQAFADEIFRVFAARHPQIELVEINANSAVKRMITRVRDSNLK